MCARRSVQAEAAEACNGLVCETSAKMHFANSDLMCATRSVLQCSTACARATIQNWEERHGKALVLALMLHDHPYLSREGPNDHGNKK